MMYTANQTWAIYEPSFKNWLAGIRGVRPRAIAESPRRGNESQYDGLPVRLSGGTAVVNVTGVLIKGAPRWLESYGISATDRITHAVRVATADTQVGSVLLRVDSPGGSVDGMSELGDAIQAARQVKAVVAYVDGMAASAAYYVASQAGHIISERTALIGSVGVRMILYDLSELFARDGVKPVVITTGPYKAAGAPGTEITSEQQEDFQRIVDGYFGEFVSAVSNGRRVPAPTVKHGWGTGQVWLAPEARTMRMIDGLGNLADALGIARTQATGRALADARTRQTAARVREMAGWVAAYC